MDNPLFVPALFAKPPRENAPSFVKARVSMKGDDIQKLADFLSQHVKGDGWINMDLCESRDPSKWYFKLDTWTKDTETMKRDDVANDDINPADIPF